MGFFDRLKTDNNRMLTYDMRDLTLFNASNVQYDGKGRFTDVNFQISPQGQLSNTRKGSIAFSIDEFSSITGADENYEKWQCQLLNSKGETVKGVLKNIYIDRTIGYVSANFTFTKVSE